MLDNTDTEEYFNYNYDSIMEDDGLSDMDRERVWIASFTKN